MGFNKPANPDVVSTFKAAIDKINALPGAAGIHSAHRRHQPSFEAGRVRHRRPVSEERAAPKTSSLSPASTTSSTMTASSIWSATARARKGAGWYSFDKKGVHFVGLVNVMNLKAGGLGSLGAEQLEWLEKDVEASLQEHAHRRVRAHSAVERLSGMGLGHGRQRARRCRT